MEWSKLKNIILLLLVSVNAFLLILVGVQESRAARYEEDTRQAAVRVLEQSGITALLEPLNNLGDDTGMSVTTTQTGADIVRAVDSPNVRLLCDVYHMQVMHGDLMGNLWRNLDIVPYIHLADAPERHEPGTGEINFDYLLPQTAAEGFDGTICFEYFPAGDTEAGFPALHRLETLF